ncbi:MAG: ribulokinase [Planctomycetes bacterium]|nr:ribulokinase [Planctomycetota bacterium]
MPAAPACSLGLDLGTGSARALIVETSTGREAGSAVAPFERGEGGVIGDPRDPLVARQHPADWIEALERSVKGALEAARGSDGVFQPGRIAGIGIDATASTPLAVDSRCVPLALAEPFAGDPAALAWLWKDHTAHLEAGEITRAAERERPELLAKCGGAYSSEWYFAKLLRCLRSSPRVLEAADGWLEEGDYLAGLLCGAASPRDVARGACAAGHKALHNADWGGWPSLDLLARVDPALARWCRGRLGERVLPSDRPAGRLSREWGARLGLPTGIPVACAMIDAHAGAVGAGIRPGVLVKILGTSACDMLVHPASEPLADIPGICGVARDSIVPGCLGLEAGQSAVGDIFAWFARGFGGAPQEALAEEAARLRPGASGLVALDWHNGNRSVLQDPRLAGLVLGETLATRPAELYRALVEATAFGARVIMERFEEHRVPVCEVVACGGIAAKNPFLLQLYADVTGRAIEVSRSQETCALGAAIFGAVAGGAHRTVEEAQRAMTCVSGAAYVPRPASKAVYDEIYGLYRALHDAFGLPGHPAGLHGALKRLIAIRERERARG